MSFAQKLTGLVAGPADGPQDDTPWLLRYGARGLGIVAFLRHTLWILELFRSTDDKFCECFVGHFADTGRYCGDGDRSARLLHVH